MADSLHYPYYGGYQYRDSFSIDMTPETYQLWYEYFYGWPVWRAKARVIDMRARARRRGRRK